MVRLVFCVDETGLILRAQGRLEKYIGKSAADLCGSSFLLLFAKDYAALISSMLLKLKPHEASCTLDAPVLANNHLLKPYHWHFRKATGRQLIVCTATPAHLAENKVAALPDPLQAIPKVADGAQIPLEQHSLVAFLEKTSDGVVTLDSSFCFTYLNSLGCQLLNTSADALIGKNIWQMYPELVDSEFYNALHQALDQQQYTELTSYFPRMQKWLWRRIHPSTSGLLIFFSDISQQVQREQKIRQTQKELHDLQWAMNAAANVSMTDAEGKLIWVNENFCRLNQCTSEELLGQPHGFLSSPFVTEAMARDIVQTYLQGKVWQGELQHAARDGGSMWVLSTIVPIRDEKGNFLRNIVFCQDITKKKLAEKELRESEKLYRTLVENYEDAVLLTDLHGNIIKVNQQAVQLSGIARDTLQGRNLMEYFSADDRAKISAAMPQLLEGKSLQLQTVISSFSSSFASFVSIIPIKDAEDLGHFLVKFRDISQKIDYEKDLSLLQDASLGLSNSSSLKTGISTVTRLLCKYGDFQYGEFWMPLYGQKLLKMKSSWWSDNSFRIMHAAAEFNTYELSVDKPEIFGSSKWYFSGNVQADKNFRRKAEAASCGIRSFLSVPVLYRDQLLGVFCLFTTQALHKPLLDVNRLQDLLGKLGSELERRNSAEELDRFFTLSPELLGIMSFSGKAIKFNPAFQHLLGYDEQEMKNILIRELVHPEDGELVKHVRTGMLQGRAYKNINLRYRCKNGSYRWLSCSTQPVVEENLYYITANDVTLQKQQLAEIERIKIAVDSTADAVGIASDMQHILYVNKAFEKLLGWQTENLNVLGWTKVFVQPELPYKIVEHLYLHGSWEGDVELYDTKGNIKDFNLRANTFADSQQSLNYLVGVFTDISAQKEAQREVQRLSKAVEESANEVYIYNIDTLQFTYANKRAQQNLGYDSEAFEWLAPWQISPDYKKYTYLRRVLPLIKGQVKSLYFKAMHQRKDGSSYPAEVHLSWFQDRATNSFMAHVIDITEQQKAEEALLQINERYRLVTKATNDAIWDWDPIKQICYYGEGYKSLFGHDFANSLGGMDHWAANVHPDDAERVVSNVLTVESRGIEDWVIEYRFRCSDGSYKFVKDQGYVMYNKEGIVTRMTGALSDISEQKRIEGLLREFNAELEKKVDEKTSKLGHALRLMRQEVIARIRTEESLQQSLQEKEVLLKEIHHRVKNNMAVISGLLSLQSRYVKQDALKTILKDSQSRIKSMALIHELLYQNENLARIRFRNYIDKLTLELSRSFQSAHTSVALLIDAQDLELDIVQAVPCGLILNELITNCYKYAFPNKQKGEIRISFSRTNETYSLKVADNGIGFPEHFNWQKTGTLGMQLVNNLSRQLGGTLEVHNQEGVTLVVLWKEPGAVSQK